MASTVGQGTSFSFEIFKNIEAHTCTDEIKGSNNIQKFKKDSGDIVFETEEQELVPKMSIPTLDEKATMKMKIKSNKENDDGVPSTREYRGGKECLGSFYSDSSDGDYNPLRV